MCISETTRRMVSIGHGEPAMIPVRRLERSNDANSGCSSWAMNIVGTPKSDVQRSSWTARSVAPGSKAASGITMHEPCVVQPRLPITMPKQW